MAITRKFPRQVDSLVKSATTLLFKQETKAPPPSKRPRRSTSETNSLDEDEPAGPSADGGGRERLSEVPDEVLISPGKRS